MKSNQPYEVLKGLPPYGPMYVPVTHTGEPFHSEGFVVKFYRADGSDWTANFEPGWTDYSETFYFQEHNRVVVVANGAVFVMSPESENPIRNFGVTIKDSIQSQSGSLIFSDDVQIIVMNNETGELWNSERVSWDGIRKLKLEGDLLTGEAYDPTNSNHHWSEFELNIKTRELKNSSYQGFLEKNELTVGEDGMLKEKKKKGSWWRIWNKRKTSA